MPIDPDSLGKLLDDYWAILVEWVGGARDGAEDVVQTAFIKLASEEKVPTNCVAWLFAVSKRLAINDRFSRTKRRLRESNAANCIRSLDDSVVGIEIRELLNILESREREVVIARIWGGLTFEDIGEAIGDSKATIWRSYQSGILKLRNAYGDLGDEKRSRSIYGQ